jgi:tRNA threonylcarbamoyladenosine biosynthesis protein TsaE
VDAYRLDRSAGSGLGALQLDDLDLDASLEESVTVVEWGSGVAEGLADDRLEIEILRAHGDDAEADGDTRTLRLGAVGDRWANVDLGAALSPETGK